MSKKYKVMYSPCGCCTQVMFCYLVDGPESARKVFDVVKKRMKLTEKDFESSFLKEVESE